MLEAIKNSNSWAEFVDALDALGTAKKNKGDAFELLVKLYLLTEPIYKSALRNVWLHWEIPQRVVDRLNLPQPEIGVDIVAEAYSGKYWAIQCKFHQDPEQTVSLSEVSSFFAITERAQTPPILSDYKVITIGVLSTDIKALIEKNTALYFDTKNWSYQNDATTFAAAIALRKAIDSYAIKHAISFYKTIKRAEDFKTLNNNFPQLSDGVDSIESFHVSGKDGTGVRSKTIDQFLGVKPSLLTNARCLTEGVDIPAIDAVVFADPKQSKIDIVQAAGRAFRLAENKNYGYIIIPVIIDADDVHVTESAFAQIVSVISALGVSDDRIIEEYRRIISGTINCPAASSGGNNDNRITFEHYPTASKIDMDKLIKNIQLKTWDRLSFAMSARDDSRFFQWMQENPTISPKAQKKYFGAIRKISNDLLRQNLFCSSLEDLMAHEDPEQLMRIYFDVPENKANDERGNRMYSAAFRKLIEFHKASKLSPPPR